MSNYWSINLSSAAPGFPQPVPGFAPGFGPAQQAPGSVPYRPDMLVPNVRPSALPPAGQGSTVVAPGVPVASNKSQPAGDSFTGKVASESVAAFQQAGGVTYLGLGQGNGNREVAVWASPGFDPSRPYEVLLYNRGITGDNAMALSKTHMATAITQLNEAGRNVLVVMPKSPTVMNSWFAPPENANTLLQEALQGFAANTGIHLGAPTETWLMAHSGGGKSVANILAQPNVPHLDKIMLADSTYGTWAQDAAQSLERHPGPEVSVVVTQHNSERAHAQLAARGIRVDMMPANAQFKDHEGVPSYMLASFVGPTPTLSFSGYQPGQGWRPDASPNRTGPTPPPYAFRPSSQPLPALTEGARGLAVRSLQQRLCNIGVNPGTIDGIYGPHTRAAVEQAQQELGLPVTGVADVATQAALAQLSPT